MMDIEAHGLQIETKQIYLHRIVPDLVIDAYVFDSVMNGLKFLRERTATDDTEEEESKNVKVNELCSVSK